ncbi:hypothetical protein [uncultured Thiodictyon sp.]|jgi:hypothetical protein|uniref:hypothetical protein n=1 Tax=uncultured Thiodictyon sp. TaxID=1846217 RepID=UPI0025CF91EC|nr:hypothetical protein [uncultured Thiodictyon sp.]
MSKQQDAMVILEETAQSLKASAEALNAASAYDEGRLMGYYEALSTLLSQCATQDITPADLHLGADFHPESLLTPAAAVRADTIGAVAHAHPVRGNPGGDLPVKARGSGL